MAGFCFKQAGDLRRCAMKSLLLFQRSTTAALRVARPQNGKPPSSRACVATGRHRALSWNKAILLRCAILIAPRLARKRCPEIASESVRLSLPCNTHAGIELRTACDARFEHNNVPHSCTRPSCTSMNDCAQLISSKPLRFCNGRLIRTSSERRSGGTSGALSGIRKHCEDHDCYAMFRS